MFQRDEIWYDEGHLCVTGHLLFLVNFGSLLWKHKFSTADILYTSCCSATKFGSVRGLANGHLFPKFGELWPTFPEAKNFRSVYIVHFLSERYKIWQRQIHRCVAAPKGFWSLDFRELSSTFSGSANIRQRISRTLLVAAQRNLAALGSGQSTLNFVNFGPGVPRYMRRDMHQSFTDALVVLLLIFVFLVPCGKLASRQLLGVNVSHLYLIISPLIKFVVLFAVFCNLDAV